MLKPLHDNVILKKEEAAKKTASGIILTGAGEKTPSNASVVAIGPDCKAELKEHDQVVYKEYSGTKVNVDDVTYIILKEEDILAVEA